MAGSKVMLKPTAIKDLRHEIWEIGSDTPHFDGTLFCGFFWSEHRKPKIQQKTVGGLTSLGCSTKPCMQKGVNSEKYFLFFILFCMLFPNCQGNAPSNRPYHSNCILTVQIWSNSKPRSPANGIYEPAGYCPKISAVFENTVRHSKFRDWAL